ncbi:MAG TPA: hypothetical protein VF331_01170 [Polyangiales bacterium]
MAFALLVGSVGCTIAPERGVCARDDECADGALCYTDGRCLPSDAARQLGAQVGLECGVRNGRQQGCRDTETCHSGFCDGPPLFDGVASVISDSASSLRVSWSAASDATPPEHIAYEVFVSQTQHAYDWKRPALKVVGKLSARVTGVPGPQRYWVVVRAVDQFGQNDGNTHSLAAVPGCVDYTTQVQATFNAACTSCHAGAAPPRGLVLGSYNTLATGSMLRQVIVPCRASDSLLYMKISQALPPIGARMPFGGPYLDAEQISWVQSWIDQGASPTCPNEPGLCDNRTAPTFDGLTRTRLIDPTHAELCWSAASDDATPAAELVYEVYEATKIGGEDFARLPRFTTEPGQTCAVLAGRVPDEFNCWVVRARDEAGNRDANVVEHCLKMPAASCIDYRSMVQPLFDERCVHCHGALRPFRDQSFESFAASTARGTAIITPCKPSTSLLYQKIALDPPPAGQRMPADGPPFLSPAQIQLIGQWIQEGARAQCSDPNPC